MLRKSPISRLQQDNRLDAPRAIYLISIHLVYQNVYRKNNFYLREKNNFHDPEKLHANTFVGPVPKKGTEPGGDLITLVLGVKYF